MNRKYTNIIRFVLDECIPPIIRDSKWFMYPFYMYAYRGKLINEAMQFKSLVYDWNHKQYEDFYNNINTISRNRETDLNPGCIDEIIKIISNYTGSVLDVGCGNGFLLQLLKDKFSLSLTGCDVKDIMNTEGIDFKLGQLQSLCLPDKSYDIVFCCHTLEHVIDSQDFVNELKRITNKLLIVVVPCQRYYYYTLDEHVSFFHHEKQLTSLFKLSNYTCKKISGDWLYVAQM